MASFYSKLLLITAFFATLSVGGILISCAQTPPLPTSPAEVPSLAVPRIEYQSHRDWLPQAIVHTVHIPVALASQLKIEVLPDGKLQTPADFAQAFSLQNPHEHPIAVLNGGYFDPQNTRTASYVSVKGQMVADPTDNPKLTQNLALKSLLPAIFNRSELRRLQCDNATDIHFDITAHSQSCMPIQTETGTRTCAMIDSLGAGPQLLPEFTAEREAFIQTDNGRVTRDPIGVNALNARSAVGLTPQGDIWWVMVEQGARGKGASLSQVAAVFKRLGVVKALALDGGSSSALWLASPLVVQPTTVWGKRDAKGQTVHRPVKSFLVLTETHTGI